MLIALTKPRILRMVLLTATLRFLLGGGSRDSLALLFRPSAPLKELQKKFGFEPDEVVSVAKELLLS